ncbi:hypothetical protein CHS0354_025261 [Potamilus streckersoni]|uniref:Ubiquitin-like protease family profile domain-containing protein n=1 Tax=Potamilus streckersoni TaxID=2493646 RepID=A0AAE0VJ20_9BIVA|nr:hypothetical protein CHS0354_025261 [Potamilus streckersoni]
MSLLPALNESEATSDLGWSASNRFSSSAPTESHSESDIEWPHSNTPLEKSKLVQHLMRRSPGSASNQRHVFSPTEDKQNFVYTTETSHAPTTSIIQQSVSSQTQKVQQQLPKQQLNQQPQQQPQQLIQQPTSSNSCYIIISSNHCQASQVVTQGLQCDQQVTVNKPGHAKSGQKIIAFGHNPATHIQNVHNVANFAIKSRQTLNQAPVQIVDSSVQNTQPVQILNSQFPTVGVSQNLQGHSNNVASPSAGSPVLTQILQQAKPPTANIVIVATDGQGHNSTTLLNNSQYSTSSFSPGRGGGKGRGNGRGRGTLSQAGKVQIPKVVTITQTGAPQQQMGGQITSGISKAFKAVGSEGSSTIATSSSRTPPPNILHQSSSSSTGMPASAATSQKGYNIAQLASSQTVKVAGGGELQEDMIYLIKDSSGDQIRMVWKNGQFLPLDEETNTILSVSGIYNSSGPTRGYGRGQTQKSLQGNVTGLLMAQTRGRKRTFRGGFQHQDRIGSSLTMATDSDDFNILPNGRVFLNADKKTFGSPHAFDDEQVDLLETKSTPKNMTVDASSLESSNTQEGSSNKKDEVVKSYTEEDNNTEFADSQAFVDNTFAVCQFCGYNSSCLIKCDRCSRKFNDKTKRLIEDFKRAKIELENLTDSGVTQIESDNSIDKKTFYGKKLEQMTQVYDSKILIMTERSTGTCGEMLSTGCGSPVSVKAIRTPRGRRARAGRGRGRHVTFVPETVMISSDEDEPGSKTPKLVAESSKPESFNQDSCSSSPSTVAEEERSSSPMFPITSTVKRGSSPVFPKSRRERMEDEQGNLILKPKIGEKVEVTLLPKTIRVGSFLGAAIEPILLSEDGIYFYMESVDGSHKFCIHPYEIIQCLSHFNPVGQSMMFFLTTSGCAVRIRKDLGIKPHTDPALPAQDPYFDPQSKEEAHQLVTVVLGTVNDNIKADFTKLMELYKETQVQTPEKDDQSFYMELNEEEAYQVYEQSCKKKPVGINLSPAKTTPSMQLTDHAYFAIEEDSSCLSPPMLGFTGPVLKILTYPAPPATGGIPITNEDLFCLNEGEFLNDVIIDFYIKYLFLEKLGQKDRKRTHVFSSFFFKRLTQRNASTAADEDACVTPAEKRHARVRTWTRHVDLFEKDFIIIPINEHSHWFLAIICFPGLPSIQYVPYLPRHYISKPSPADTSSESTSTSTSALASPRYSDAKMDIDTSADENGIVLPQTDIETDTPEPENPIPENDSVEDKEPAVETPEKPSFLSNLYMSHRGRCPEIRGQILDPIPPDLEKEPLPKNYTLGQRQPCILLLDSLPGPSRTRIVSILKEYLQVEWNVKKKGEYNRERLRGSIPKVPQQTNFSDCGVYVLQYVESFFEDPIQDFTIPIRGLQNWFPLERVDRKRTEIRNLILSLKDEYEAA